MEVIEYVRTTERRTTMPVEQRIRLCLLLEKMYVRKEYSEKLGLEDKTKFHGEQLHGEEGKSVCYH